MTRKSYLLLGMAIVFIISTSTCGVVSVIPTAATTPTQSPPLAASVKAPTRQVVAASSTQPSAPLCENIGSSCAAPEVHDTEALNTYCVKKIPYTNILIDPGTIFEVTDKSGDFACADSGQVVEGKTVLTCTGKQLLSFKLKLTNPACAGGNLLTGTGQCQEGFGLDASQSCCAPIPDDTAGSVTITVNIGACHP